MPRYNLPVQWMETADMIIEADSLEEAITKAVDCADLPDGTYLDSSFEVNREMLEQDAVGVAYGKISD